MSDSPTKGFNSIVRIADLVGRLLLLVTASFTGASLAQQQVLPNGLCSVEQTEPRIQGSSVEERLFPESMWR